MKITGEKTELRPALESDRNKRAIAAYSKAGFEYVKTLSKEEQIKEFGISEYDDNILMIKRGV